MAQTHITDPPQRFEYRLGPNVLDAKALDVAVVGVGGTGSEVICGLINLHLGLIALGYGGLNVIAFDPDVVAEANIVRQRYSPSDIGFPKASVLINRINLSYALGWTGVPERFGGTYANRSYDLVISCVDTRQARKDLHRAAFRERFGIWKLWMDCGNDRSSGQVILGTPRSMKNRVLHMLPCATELHPELCDTTIPEHDVPSCSAAEALSHQDLMVNKMVSVLAIDLIWRLFRDGRIDVHARYFDLASSTVSARNVPPPLPRAQRRRRHRSAGR